MKLKRLVLQGYKTFATKTEFIFDDGITAVVGPNGSGKSNVADAIRWVLGEQSYGTLRGKRTVDMIFAGSQARARAGMASAMLTLDNSDGWLPIDYSEVEIGRRAYRSGENDYILNGQKVRLKDITDLLATSGLAERTYTIIGQGLIDQALSLRAEERRALFEEAAGISHYKARRAETLRRLNDTQHNLERIHDILAEIKPRLASLKRQATRARNYEQVATDLRHLLYIWYGYQWEQGKIKLRTARTTAVAVEQTWQASRDQLRAQQEKIDHQRRVINHVQELVGDSQTRRDQTRDQLEKVRREVAILRERQESTQRQLQDIAQDLPLVEKQHTVAQTELQQALAELSEAQQQLQLAQSDLQTFNSTFEVQQVAINEWQTRLQQAELDQRRGQTELAQAEGQLSQLQERLKEYETAVAPPDDADEQQQLAKTIEQQTAVLTATQQKIAELQIQRSRAQDERQALIKQLKMLRRENREQEQALNKQRNNLARLEARVDMLDQMRHKETKVAPDVTVLGSFASYITIPPAQQPAIEAALEARLATLILPDEANLWQLLAGQKEGGVTAVALKQLAPPHHQLPIANGQLAIDLVTYPPEIAPVAQLLLGGILLVEDAQTAYDVARTLPLGTLAVTPDGLVVHAGGLVVARGQSTANSLLAREAEWREGRAALQTEKATLQQAEKTFAFQQTLIQEKQDEADGLQDEERRLGRLEYEATQRVTQAQRQLDQAHQRQQFLAQQQERQQQEVERLHQRMATVQQTIATQQEQTAVWETAVTTARAELAQLPIAEAKQQREGLRQNVTAAQTIVAGRQAVVDSRRATLNQVERQLGRLAERQASLERQEAQISLTQEEAQLAALRAEYDRLEEELLPLRERLATARKKLVELEEETAVFQKQAHDHESQYTQTRIALTQQQNQIENLQERIKAELGTVALEYDDDQTGPTPLPMDGVFEQLPVITELPDDIEATLQSYRGQMQRMGAINPDAPEEYETTQERHDFLEQQVDDLNQTESQLRQIITELDELTSRAFAETVEKVNDVFGDTFAQLFGGGSARLLLTDPDDLTISGVDIIARLPNRREQGLGLLSGGERSLTAGALIFSLLKVSPTPFCVMDEVDAALDEANVNRFRDLLRELSLKTQFVVITHNRGTVQAAHTIYGISMGSDSASQVLSIKPEEYLVQGHDE